ncbi:ATP/GTP-binding protein [Streptomyces sp. ISL-66]|uniref:ATP/GTP-binding protein n=1 Tax=Streptomyces sp. ISL-66 TaxID=2819186 RepID=UPI001BEB254C|nr:ATP/GTP-binding protein [Streptomyces sp. ISL-66]MBT2469365.1 ATP/GTP-binding protein [Streptomyces sp. ISL-66]
MAGRDLRALFSTNDRRLNVVEAFTDRQRQWEAVVDALTEHLAYVARPTFDPEDLEAPRNNTLAFYGVGGVGKSTLSRKLEAALADSGERPERWTTPAWPAGHRILPVRIDLARSAGIDFERVVLAIRLALAELGRPLPAFDLALRHYWEVQHPGEPLEEYLRRDGLGARFGKAMPQQLQSALGDIAQTLLLPGTVGSVVGQVTGSLVKALREHRQTVRALAGCTRLADLLEAEPTLDTLSYYPHLLAWEIHQLPPDKRVTPVILLDTMEDSGDRTHRDLERLLQRVVWLMPGAFFVITGRNRLQWADQNIEGQLDWTGPASWPGLAARTPAPRSADPAAVPQGRQILIGDFSPEDRDDYLARRLTRDGQPLISAEIRTVIGEHSHGLPLHLDLAVLRFLEIQRTRTPVPADFDVPFPALIARTLSDLTPDERHVLRSVSVLDSFDVDLATRAAGLTRQAPALRLAERPFVREDSFNLWPFHLHALIRSTLRTADDQTDDRWSPDDWDQAAARALAGLGTQWVQGDARDRRLLVGCLRQGLAVARDFGLDLEWLADAAWAYVSDDVWEPLPARTNPDDDGLRTPADALVETLSALSRRQHEHRERTVARLTTVIDSSLLPADLHEMCLYYRAKADRDLGRTTESRDGMQQVSDGDGRLAPFARRGLAHLARLGGDFPTALAIAETLGWPGRHHRVLGDVHWVQGDMQRAAAEYEAAREDAAHHGVVGEQATAQAQRAFAIAFIDPDQTDRELEVAEQLLAGVALRASAITAKTAALIRDAGTTAPGYDARIETLRAEIREAGVAAAEAALDLTIAFHHAVLGNEDQTDAAITRIRGLTQNGDYSYYTDLVAFMVGRTLAAPSTASWPEGEPVVRARWHGLVQDRQEHWRAGA